MGAQQPQEHPSAQEAAHPPAPARMPPPREPKAAAGFRGARPSSPPSRRSLKCPGHRGHAVTCVALDSQSTPVPGVSCHWDPRQTGLLSKGPWRDTAVSGRPPSASTRDHGAEAEKGPGARMAEGPACKRQPGRPWEGHCEGEGLTCHLLRPCLPSGSSGHCGVGMDPGAQCCVLGTCAGRQPSGRWVSPGVLSTKQAAGAQGPGRKEGRLLRPLSSCCMFAPRPELRCTQPWGGKSP